MTQKHIGLNGNKKIIIFLKKVEKIFGSFKKKYYLCIEIRTWGVTEWCESGYQRVKPTNLKKKNKKS